MSEPEVALAFSPEPWVEAFHRHCADHGGARVRQLVLEPSLVLEERYDVLVVSHRWPALTRALVDAVHSHGRMLVGIFDPCEPAGSDHLVALGVDRALPADLPMIQLVDAIRSVVPTHHDAETFSLPPADRSVGSVVVVAGPAGGGATEVAVGTARSLQAARERCVLVDADEVAPALAPRLGLPIEPNLRSAVDAVEHRGGEVRSEITVARCGLHVVAGLPNVAAWAQVRASELVRLLEALAAGFTRVIVDVSSRLDDVGPPARGRYALTRAALARADMVVAVADGTPIGAIRLLWWLAEARGVNQAAPVHVVVNRAPADGYRRSELADEITRGFAPASLSFVPSDGRVGAAIWAALPVASGPFTRGVDRVVRELRRATEPRGGASVQSPTGVGRMQFVGASR